MVAVPKIPFVQPSEPLQRRKVNTTDLQQRSSAKTPLKANNDDPASERSHRMLHSRQNVVFYAQDEEGGGRGTPDLN